MRLQSYGAGLRKYQTKACYGWIRKNQNETLPNFHCGGPDSVKTLCVQSALEMHPQETRIKML